MGRHHIAVLLALPACKYDAPPIPPDTTRDTAQSEDTYVADCDGWVSFGPALYGTGPVYYRDTFAIGSPWGSEPFETWIGSSEDGVRAETRVRRFDQPDNYVVWRVVEGGFKPDSLIEFTMMRCVDPASGGIPVRGGVGVFTSHLGAPVPATVVDGTTWAFDFPRSLRELVVGANTDREPEPITPLDPMFADRLILLRFDAASDAAPAVVTMGWAVRSTGLQDLCRSTRTTPLDRPWGREAFFDPVFGDFSFLDSWWGTGFHPSGLEMMGLSIFGTFEPDGGRIAFPRWRALLPEDALFPPSIPPTHCKETPEHCEPCPDGSGRTCMEYMENAIDAWRSPTALIDRPAEVVALDPACGGG